MMLVVVSFMYGINAFHYIYDISVHIQSLINLCSITLEATMNTELILEAFNFILMINYNTG
jgi:hypothetical protein